MKMLKGELSPADGHINYLEGKKVVTLNPSVQKRDQFLSVTDFLAQFSTSQEAIKEVYDLTSFLVVLTLFSFVGLKWILLRRPSSCSYLEHLNSIKHLPSSTSVASIHPP
jgi:hypothetical protein